MSKSLAQTINEMATKTPGNATLPKEGSDPGKGGNDPKAKGKPEAPDKLLTDPEEKNRDTDKVTKVKKSAEPQDAKKNGEPRQKVASKTPGQTKEELEYDEDGVELDEDQYEDDDVIEISDEIAALVNELDEDELKERYAELLAVLAEADDEAEYEASLDEDSEAAISEIRTRITAADIDINEDVDALLVDEGDLSEEFQNKAKTIFGAAVASKVNQELDALEEGFKIAFSESLQQIEEDLSERVDRYLTYVAEEWMKENEVAIDTGLQAEITENFMTGLKSLFEDHYIDIPESKLDVVEVLANENEELKAKLNEAIDANIETEKTQEKLMRIEILGEECAGLADSQVEKLVDLSEGVEFDSEDQFRSALTILKESYFADSNSREYSNDDLNEIDEELITEEEAGKFDNIDPTMQQYVRHLGSSVK